jgi:hypothetical protein
MTPPSHPSDLALELFLLQPEESPEKGHLSACPTCTTRLAQMREEGEDFKRFVFPQTVEAVEDAMEKRPFAWRALFKVLVPVGAAAALAVTLLLPSGPPDDYVGVKGSGMILSVFVNGADGASALPDGAKVPAGAALRFKIKPEKNDCHLWIASVDAKGEISRIYPPAGTKPQCLGAGAVPGGAVLDGQPGPERIFALCAPSENTDWPEVKAALQGAAGGAEHVRTAKSLKGPLSKRFNATLLLEKQP